MSTDLGNMATGTLTIDGVVNGDDRSTIDMNGHNGFVLEEDTDIVLSDVRVINGGDTLIDNRSPSSTVTISNTEITNNNADDAIIRSSGEVNIIADNGTTSIIENNAEDAIYMAGSDLNLNAQNEGLITIGGNIDGEGYNLNIEGDGSGSIDIKDEIKGVKDIVFKGDSELGVGIETEVHAENTTITSEVITTVNGDSLDLVVQADIGDREFVSEDAAETYTLSTDLGNMATGTLSIDGVVDGDDRSTIDMNGHNGFVLDKAENTLSMSDIKVTGSASGTGSLINNASGVVTMSNVIIEGSDDSINNDSEMKLSGMNELLAGVVGEGSLSITSGETSASTISQNEVNIADNGKLNIDASNLSANNLNNSGTLNFTGGENSNEVNGDGTTSINGEVVNSALIEQDIRIESGKLTSSLENMGGAIANSGTLLASGELDKTISGNGETIISSTMSFAENAGISGSLNLNEGALTISSGSATSHEIGSLAGNGSLSLDVDMNNNIADVLNIGSIGSGTLTIDNLNIIGTLDDFSHVILNSNNIDDEFSLELASSVYDEFYSISSATTYDVDEVTAHTLWSDVFETDEIITTTEKEASVAA